MRLSYLILLLLLVTPLRADDWPQWRGPTRDGEWRENGVVEKFDSPQLKILWRAPIASGYSGPTVADGRVYVTDRLTDPTQIERVHCFDAKTGKSIWKYEYDCPYKISYEAGPRASVSIDEGRAYALGAMGHFFCFEAASGKVIWQKNLQDEYQIRMPIWGISASPLIDGDRVIVQIGGENNACLVAFDKRTGSELWRSLPDRASYCAPILIEQAGKRVLVCLTGDHVVGLDPATGKPYWEHPFPPTKMVIAISTPVALNDRLFVTSFYDGCLMLRLDPDKLEVEKLWRRQGRDEKNTDGLHSIISTPLLQGGYVYGVDSYGELRCLEATTGERLWEDRTATPPARWSTIHMVRNGERIWMFNERGELIISRLSPQGYEEISRAKLIDPTTDQLRQRGGVCWAHPAYADRCVFARNDKELVCADLSAQSASN
jgi:outer membrane protein assembly factor BamB